MPDGDVPGSSSTSRPLWRDTGSPESLSIGQVVDRYRVVGRGGRGGMGEVYEVRATDGEGGRLALKVILAGEKPEAIDEELRLRIRREADSLARLSHPNIVRFIRSGDDPTTGPFLVMEWLDGQTLAAWLARRSVRQGGESAAPRLTADELSLRVDLFAQIARAVAHAHERGIVIRDIKPSNIMVTEVGGVTTARLVDFGLVTSEHIGRPDHDDITATLQRCGSCLYASPEQWYHGRHGVRGDIYSLGVVLYEMLVGEHPGALHPRSSWPPSRSVGARQSIYAATILAATGHSGLAAPILRAIEWHERLRYRSAGAFIADLTRALDDRPTSAARSAPLRSAYRGLADRPGLSIAVLVAAVAITLASVFAAQVQSRGKVLVLAREAIAEFTTNLEVQLERVGSMGEKEAGIESVLHRLASLMESDPNDIDTALLMARAEGLAGDAEYRVGRFRQSEERWQAARDRLLRLTAIAPGRIDVKRRSIVALIRLGDIAKHDGRREAEAFAMYDAAEAETEALLAAHPANLDLLDDYCWCLERRVEHASLVGDREQAHAVAIERLTHAETLIERRPGEALALWNLHQAYTNCCATATNLGRLDEAATWTAKADGVVEDLHASDPENVRFHVAYVRSLTIRARKGWMESSRDAVDALERLALEKAALARSDPGTLQSRKDWIESIWSGGLAESLREDHARACDHLAQTVEEVAKLELEYPVDRELLALALNVRGDFAVVLERAGRVEEARLAAAERDACERRLRENEP